MGVSGVLVNSGVISDAIIQEVEIKHEVTRGFVSDAGNEPILIFTRFARYRVKFADFTREREGSFKISGGEFDKCE